MRAIVQPKYGPPESVELAEVPKPEPREGEVLVRVHASSLNGADIETLSGWWLVRMASPLRPASRVGGSDVAGVVVEPHHHRQRRDELQLQLAGDLEAVGRGDLARQRPADHQTAQRQQRRPGRVLDHVPTEQSGAPRDGRDDREEEPPHAAGSP